MSGYNFQKILYFCLIIYFTFTNSIRHSFKGFPNTKSENIFSFCEMGLSRIGLYFAQIRYMMISLKSVWGLLQMITPTLITHTLLIPKACRLIYYHLSRHAWLSSGLYSLVKVQIQV